MGSEQNNCSLPEHSEEKAVFYCPECKRYMCNNCYNSHSSFSKIYHNQHKVEKDKNISFTGICKVKNHLVELIYFCKTHNVLCCPLCIVKIKDDKFSIHSGCEVCKIEEIAVDKKLKLKENITNIVNISRKTEMRIDKLKLISHYNDENKEDIKLTIRNIFNKIMNEIKKREIELLSKIDALFDVIQVKKEIIDGLEKLNEDIEFSLNEWKSIESQWDQAKLNVSINNCLTLEKNINKINEIDEKMKNYKTTNITIKFEPGMDNIKPFLDNIAKFGNILYKSNLEITDEVNEILKEKGRKFIDFDTFKNELNSIKDLETLLNILILMKEQILEKCIQNNETNFIFEPIEIKSDITLFKIEANKAIDKIINSIESIIEFSKVNKKLLVYFDCAFWKNIFNYFNQPIIEYIDSCYKFRQTFIHYHNLINELYQEDNKAIYKNEINQFYEKDEFSFYLDINIKKYIELKQLNNLSIIGIITKYNPYYNINEEQDNKRYSDKRDINILDFINFDKVNELFIEDFKKFNFELIFQNNIKSFLAKIISKIKNINDFNLVLRLIDLGKIPNNKNEFFELMKDKYEAYIKKELETLTGNKLTEGVKILVKFIFILYKHERSFKFIEEHIKKLDKKIVNLIYNELIMTEYNLEKGENFKILIFQDYFKDSDSLNIINLIQTTQQRDKGKYIRKLKNLCNFSKEEFFSNKENKNIELFCEIINGLQKDGEYNTYFEELNIDKIYQDLEGDIEKQKLEHFLSFNKEIILKRMKLIKSYYNDYIPKKEYKKLKETIEKINKEIADLTFIKDSLLALKYRIKYKKDINDITNMIKNLQKWKI